MNVVASWTGERADALRQALRMTNETFAEHLGVAVRTVANWRKIPATVPQTETQRILDTALDRAPDRAKAQFAALLGTFSLRPSGYLVLTVQALMIAAITAAASRRTLFATLDDIE